MSSQKFVKATIIRQNTIMLPTPLNREVDCDNITVLGIEWLVPTSTNGLVPEYSNRKYATAPTADSIKTLRIQNNVTGVSQWLLLTSAQVESDFVAFCNACCGSGNDFTNTVNTTNVPAAINEDTVCADISGNYTFYADIPFNPFSNKIQINAAAYSINGTPGLGFTQTAGGYASLAALVTALNSSASGAGTWSSSGGRLKLVSTTTHSAHVDIDLAPASFCMPLPSSAFTATTLVVKDNSNADQSITLSAPLVVSQANAANVAIALAAYFPDAAPIVSTTNIQYTGLMKPVKLTDGTTNAVFASGVC